MMWWTPEGKPVSKELLQGFANPNSSAQGAAILRVSPFDSPAPDGQTVDLGGTRQNIRRSISSNGEVSRLMIGPAGKPFTDPDQTESFLLVPVWKLDRLEEVNIDVNFGVGSWKSFGTVPAVKESEAKAKGYKITIHNFHEHQFSRSSRLVLFSQIHTSVPDKTESGLPALEELRLEAVTKSKQRVLSGSHRGVYAPDPRQKRPSQFGLTEEFSGVRSSEIEHFDVQIRPIESLKIGPVNFHPSGLPVEAPESSK